MIKFSEFRDVDDVRNLFCEANFRLKRGDPK